LLSFILIFEITQSADIIVDTTLTAFFKAALVTRTGSIIPASIMLTVSPVTTLIPNPSSLIGAACSNFHSLPIGVTDIPAFSSIT
jgi:hypothetical protein